MRACVRACVRVQLRMHLRACVCVHCSTWLGGWRGDLLVALRGVLPDRPLDLMSLPTRLLLLRAGVLEPRYTSVRPLAVAQLAWSSG